MATHITIYCLAPPLSAASSTRETPLSNMAPTKAEGEKEKKLTPQESAAMILEYLQRTNRPYSATDISANLKNRVTKAAAAKILKDMHERQEIEGRASGKQLVYHALQDAPEDGLEESLKEMESQTTRLKQETVALVSEEKELRASLRKDNAQIPLPQLRAKIAAMEQEKTDIEARLATLRTGNVKPVSPTSKSKIHKRHFRVQKSFVARKKIRKELWGMVEEALGPSKATEKKEELDLSF